MFVPGRMHQSRAFQSKEKKKQVAYLKKKNFLHFEKYLNFSLILFCGVET